jgi:serine/threonine protein kinase
VRLMHSLGIVHYDIKPDNIMFSRTLSKLLMIDFNLSDITNFELGGKYIIPFRGTINFCCPDMVNNFVLGDNPNYVDPYYNDVYCLKESMLCFSLQSIEKLAEDKHFI